MNPGKSVYHWRRTITVIADSAGLAAAFLLPAVAYGAIMVFALLAGRRRMSPYLARIDTAIPT